MTLKRLGALVAAIVLIAGAWVLRTNVLDDDENTGGGGASNELDVLVCAEELAAACNAAGNQVGIDVRIEPADTTLRNWSSNPTDELAPNGWATLQPLPEMAALSRDAAEDPLEIETVEVSTSPLVLVVDASRAPLLVDACGDPVEWRCLGELAETSWSDIDASASNGTVRPGFARTPDTAIGQLGVGAALLGAFDGAPLVGNPDVIVWGQPLVEAVPARSLVADTAIGTIQVRQSALDVAVGARAELINPDDPRFTVVDVEQPIDATVVIARPMGGGVPDALRSALADELTASGWAAPSGESSVPSANDLLNTTAVWENLNS
ncbi:MAG: hypothetical protein AAFY28_13430 [Actinomycetota bacterium]